MGTRRRTTSGRGSWGFNFATVVQVFAIPVLSAIVYLTVQWVTTDVTLKKHETDIAVNQRDIKEEAAARERTRNEFLDKLSKLNEGIGTLNTNLALQGQVLTTIKEELTKRNK